MMSVAPVASAGTAAAYYSNADNYYFLGNLQSLWLGEGAKSLGLEGNVQGDALTAILEGRLPDGSRLGKEINGNHVHRPGHDLTFSAPKSVSILALIGEDKEMLEAHNHAVRVAAGYVEKLISARATKDGITSIVHTGRMVAAAFTHDTSRNLDPQLHTHLLVANMTEQDGKWKALATDYIHNAGFIETVMKMQVTLGKIYRSALRQRVEALGHEVEEVGKHGMWEIKGVPEEVREDLSSRGREIQGAVGAEATLRSRDVAAKDTRQAKVDPSRLRLMERWLGQLKDRGYDLKAYQDSVVPRSDASRDMRPQPVKSAPEQPGRMETVDTPGMQSPEITAKGEDKGGNGAERSDPPSLQASTPQPHSAPVQQPLSITKPEPLKSLAPAEEPVQVPEVMDAVRMAISQLSDNRTRFTFGELMLTTAELSEQLPEMNVIRQAIDAALKEGSIVPLDSEKGVFTSRIHLLDELSIQALSQEHLKSTAVVSFQRPAQYAPAALEVVEQDALVLMNAPSGVAGIRELTAQLTDISMAQGREVQVLASSAERAISLARSDTLRDRLVSRQQVLSGDFHLKPQSTLIIEGAERLGLKETLVLLGEARAQDAQLVFLDSAGRQANGNAMSVLESAGVPRSRRTEPAPGLQAEVISIANKRDRYEALAGRFADLSGSHENVTAVVVGKREQAQLTGLIRDALQNAGQLDRNGISIEARSPVWLDSKTRRMPGSYRSGMVLEDRSNAKERHSYVIDRVHEDTRMLSLIDGDGVLTRMKISEVTADWRLFNRETLNVATGERLMAVAGDREHDLKAKDRLEVTGVSDRGIEVRRGNDALILPRDKPLYLTHAYVSAPGGRDNDSGVVLAALNSRDISSQTMNSLAQSGHRAEIFTAEVQDRAEARLQRMKTSASPVQLVRSLSGKEDVNEAVGHLHDGVRTEAGLAVWRAVNDQRTVAFSELALAEAAEKFLPDFNAIGQEIASMVKDGALMRVSVRGEPYLVARSTWEMEKSILRTVEEGKNTQQPLLDQVPSAVLNGLTAGQRQATTLVLSSRDQFTGIQGYAGVGKTTQMKAVVAALDILPAEVRPEITGLAPTHQAVKEMSDVGVRAQTIKSFIVEHDQATAAGEKPDYKGRVFLIDESSMAGNQDTAALFQAIAVGGGRAVSMGDVDQFESVDAGTPFKLMQERSPMDVAIMKEIVRQKDVQLRGAVHDIIDNRIDAALNRIIAQPSDRIAREAGAEGPESALQESQTPVADIVSDWMGRTPDVRARTLIITQLNADRHAVNAGIHEQLTARGELGKDAITVPVLDKISHTRHEFNKTAAWNAGMVVKRGDRYQDVMAVDRNGNTVTVRDEDGKVGLYSPRELIAGDVELFRRGQIEVRAGDLVRFTLTDREQGQTGNQRFKVEAVSDTGDIRLRSEKGSVTINPGNTRAQQHIDYGWAVTGYGAQGASTDYVISLEGTEEGRKALATRRAFYISASRAKEHVQIYTDGKADWTKALTMPEREIKTAHDALAPETQRQQAKAIWAMGHPVLKTAIGRAWVRHQGMGDASLTAKIIPATRRFPEPALALPVYDNNGKSAGLALVSLVSSPEGRLTQGDTRLVMTPRAQGAVLQRSQSGKTHVVKDIAAALDAVRAHPDDGVVWQTGDKAPSAHLLKITGGKTEESVLNIVEDIRRTESTVYVSENENTSPEEEKSDFTRIKEQDAQRLLAEETLATRVGLESAPEKEQPADKIIVPFEDKPVISAGMFVEKELQTLADPDPQTLINISRHETDAGSEAIRSMRSDKVPEADMSQTAPERVSRIINDMANNERDLVRQTDNTERGRMPEREEQTPSRTIQKER
ncbi:conjugative transfer relaxase/helicase TraI [Escherichia coli]|uniref:conjugative transfer relaxase/helicase TraI n=1 Tax=Escherichia coli TaxID=562 RepID=UPI0023F79AD5|nr:conjugative transfer relaxase/helicase TraI [Escherichia coli]ELU5570847.1 conjugative transfer relaxase/helicase TraI [Escherichia coli]EMB1337902.1 conjugative transfer relaxase/helicase TraI [Escherichia coli]MDF7600406.1 conjugative transfer relaxase/helicase TraI [Escherichia coli]MDF7604763.1 conjugative transfer relaxase/helicase TraI [Escherichia coli]MDF7619992.1 conjugative transfer relaxase/helicase TraI [Escherichia coli]